MALFSYPVCTWLCQYVNMGVRKWLEKSAEKQKYKMRKTANPLSRKAFRAVSFSATKDKTEGHPKGCPSVLGSAAQRAAPPFSDPTARRKHPQGGAALRMQQTPCGARLGSRLVRRPQGGASGKTAAPCRCGRFCVCISGSG